MSVTKKGLLEGARRRVRRGLTLIEAAMVLIILALVIGGVMLYYQTASTGQRTTEAAAQIASIQQAVRAMYSGQSGYSGLVNNDIRSSLPAKMTSTNGQIRHAFNGQVQVAAVNGDAAFVIVFIGVPQEACSRLATVDYGRGVLNLTVGNTMLADYTSGARVTPAAAQAACGGGTSAGADMQWTIN